MEQQAILEICEVSKTRNCWYLCSKSNDNVITDSTSKAEILNSQFKSVFTPQSGNTFPQLPGAQFSKIKPLYISENCVFMLLDRIDISKSYGPDKLPGRLLQSLAKEITPVVHFIFTQSLYTGELPTEWTPASVAPIFMKGSKLQAVNYRPVSLTCITYQGRSLRGGARGASAPLGFPVKKFLLKYSAYSLVDTLIVDIVDNVW